MRRAFWKQVREAKLLRVTAVYLAAAWLVLQVTALLQEQLHLLGWLTAIAVVLLGIGLVIVEVTAWGGAEGVAEAGEHASVIPRF